MNMPHFTADASLYTSSRTYQGAVSPGRSGAIIQLALDFPWYDYHCTPPVCPIDGFQYCCIQLDDPPFDHRICMWRHCWPRILAPGGIRY